MPSFFLHYDGPEPPGADPAGTPNWRPSDLKCAIAALKAAGVDDYRIEMAPDGTIAIVVGNPRGESESDA
jgi:hypothetical protein